jgi:hypothetical protein
MQHTFFRRNTNVSEEIVSEEIVSGNGGMLQKKLFQKKKRVSEF